MPARAAKPFKIFSLRGTLAILLTDEGNEATQQ
jgi:hypothetical protein